MLSENNPFLYRNVIYLIHKLWKGQQMTESKLKAIQYRLRFHSHRL